MTPEAQRIAIAEACGYKKVNCPSSSLGGGDPRHPEPMTYWAESFWDGDTIGLPDYLNDLNAMHEAEKVLVTGHGWKERLGRYSSKLMTVMCDTDPGRIDVAFKHDMVHLRYFTLHATAAQRAEAFLRTLNLWKD